MILLALALAVAPVEQRLRVERRTNSADVLLERLERIENEVDPPASEDALQASQALRAEWSRGLQTSTTTCATFGTLQNLRALNPPEWCNSNLQRRASQAACEATFIVRSNGRVSRCAYDASQSRCVSGSVQYDCTFPPPPPPSLPPGSSICQTPPCAASLLGDVGRTTVGGTDTRTSKTFYPGENIYGPFEAGFGSQQDSLLASLGCSPGSLGHVAGGIDTLTSEQVIAAQCSVTLPREEGGSYVSLLDECGGHTNEYHFHERLDCLYDATAQSGHSAKVGEGLDAKSLYGKWEDYATLSIPALDACGAHFGVTPDSAGVQGTVRRLWQRERREDVHNAHRLVELRPMVPVFRSVELERRRRLLAHAI
eukprot:1024686-Prymnesium_polylepis.1